MTRDVFGVAFRLHTARHVDGTFAAVVITDMRTAVLTRRAAACLRYVLAVRNQNAPVLSSRVSADCCRTSVVGAGGVVVIEKCTAVLRPRQRVKTAVKR